MRMPVWIAGSLLILAVTRPVAAQQAPSPQAPSVPQQLIRLPEHLLGIISKWLPHGTSHDDTSSQPDTAQQGKRGSLSAAERQQLRQDVNEAGRDFYRREPPVRR